MRIHCCVISFLNFFNFKKPHFHDFNFLSNRIVSKKKNVVFADGIIPGGGTSPSSSDSNDDDEMSTKKLIARSKNKKRRAKINAISPIDSLPLIDKENIANRSVSLKFKNKMTHFNTVQIAHF